MNSFLAELGRAFGVALLIIISIPIILICIILFPFVALIGMLFDILNDNY